MTLHTLPEEILIKILNYLDAVDKINFGDVCKDFHRLSLDREVLKYLNFTNNFSFQLSHLTQLSKKITCELVTVINLNGIFWPTGCQLRNQLAKFVNLTELYALDTIISALDLNILFKTATKVRKLAFSLKAENSGSLFQYKVEARLTHLFVTYNGYAMRSLNKLIQNFHKLEELWIVEPTIPFKYAIAEEPNWMNYLVHTLPTITTRIVINRQSNMLRGDHELINSFQAFDGNWLCLENIDSGSVFYVLEKFANKNAKLPSFNTKVEFEELLQKIQNDLSMTHMICTSDRRKMILKELAYSDLMFTTLKLVQVRKERGQNLLDPNQTQYLFENVLFSRNCAKLSRLCCETTPFWDHSQTQPEGVELFKKRRVGLALLPSSENCPFARFTKHATELLEFELIDKDERPFREGYWNPDCLKFIKNWKLLQKLTISSANIKSGAFLIEIAKSCENITVLKIKDESMQDILTSDLCQALLYFKNLRDFRYERRGCLAADLLFSTLAKCPSIERVYIQCRFVSKLCKDPLERIITNCKKLVLLFVYIEEMTESVCKTITQDLRKMIRYPQFIVKICGQYYSPENVRYIDIPIFHIQDVLCHSNDVYYEFLQHFGY